MNTPESGGLVRALPHRLDRAEAGRLGKIQFRMKDSVFPGDTDGLPRQGRGTNVETDDDRLRLGGSAR